MTCRARAQKRDGLRCVESVRRRDDRCVDHRIDGEPLPIAGDAIDAVPIGERPSGGLAVVRNGDEFVAVGEDPTSVEVLDVPTAEQRDAHR